MANLELSGISKLGGYLLSSEGPLDVRTVVPSKANLADLKNDYYIYPGIIVYVTDEDQHYTYTKNGTWEVFSGDQNVNSVSKNIVGNSTTATENKTVTSDTAGVYLNHLEDNTVISSHKIVGSGVTTVKSSITGDTGIITINTPATSVTNSAPTLAWNTTSTIGTVGGTALTVKMPANPNSNSAHDHTAGVGLTIGTDTGGTSGTVTYKASLVSEDKASNAASYTAGGNTKFYAVQLDKNDKLGVYVPWSNTWQANSANNNGYVTAGSGNANKVWKTNSNGEPGWRTDSNTTYTFGTGASQGQYKVDSTSYDVNGLSTTSSPTFSTVNATTFKASSDKRLKENITPYTCEKSILDLPIYEFNYIKDKNEKYIGCLAQDLQEICPEIVNTDDNGYLSIQESKIVYLLLEEVKKLRQEVAELKSKQ